MSADVKLIRLDKPHAYGVYLSGQHIGMVYRTGSLPSMQHWRTGRFPGKKFRTRAEAIAAMVQDVQLAGFQLRAAIQQTIQGQA
jgi:hypothetical protein